MIYFHACVKFAGDNTHKRNPIAVILVHIRLNLEYKGRKILLKRINHSLIRRSCKRCISHLKKMLQEGLHTKVCQRRTEKYRRQFTFGHEVKVKLRTRTIQKLNFLQKLLLSFCADFFLQCRIINRNNLLRAFLRAL